MVSVQKYWAHWITGPTICVKARSDSGWNIGILSIFHLNKFALTLRGEWLRFCFLLRWQAHMISFKWLREWFIRRRWCSPPFFSAANYDCFYKIWLWTRAKISRRRGMLNLLERTWQVMRVDRRDLRSLGSLALLFISVSGWEKNCVCPFLLLEKGESERGMNQWQMNPAVRPWLSVCTKLHFATRRSLLIAAATWAEQ